MNQYIALADHISQVFELEINSHTEDSAFVKVFRELLTNDEAETALLLGSTLESCLQIAYRTGVELTKLERNICSLVKKGIVYEEIDNSGTKKYRLLPFIPGIFESVGALLEIPQLADCLESYVMEMNAVKKKYTRQVIPVNMKVDIEVSSVNMDELMTYLNGTEHFAKMDCICRTIRQTKGKACGHPIRDMCMILGDFAEYYVRIGAAQKASREEIINLLKYAEKQGLYHEIYPIEKSRSAFVCNCCSCGCMFMGLANRIRHVIHSEQEVIVNLEKCNQCGDCVNFCPEQVFQWEGGKIAVHAEQCFACGSCVLLCDKQAIHL